MLSRLMAAIEEVDVLAEEKERREKERSAHNTDEKLHSESSMKEDLKELFTQYVVQ